MSTAVLVPAEQLFAFLASKGFAERQQRGVEIVYERRHDRDPRYRVLVYTSVRRGASAARAVGKDAIRVCAIFDDGQRSFGVAKLPRVHRTGTVDGVLERVIDRSREAYAACNQRIKENRRGSRSS